MLKINTANRITFLRIVLVIPFMVFMVVDNVYTRIFAFFIFIFASLTDLWDGLIARRYGKVTDFGKFLDPLADKLLISAAFISFVGLHELSIPAWMVVFIISREFIITGLRTIAAAKGKILAADRAGKFKTTTQMIAIITILVILIINATLRNFWDIRVGELKRFSDWRADIGWILGLTPYWLMFITTVLTIISGINYIRRHKDVFSTEI